MYHVRMKGTHYEAGCRFGKQLKNHGIDILLQVPFSITKRRIQFAQECEPYYAQYYPEILEEIKGLAEGQQASYELFLSVLLSMYCIMPDQKCTTVCFASEDGVYLGRNSDFLTSIESLYMNCIYRLKDAFAFQGNTTAFVEMEDGINEYGFAIGLTSVYPTVLKPGFNAGMIVRYLLERCQSVKEAIHLLHKLPIGSSQTFAMADSSGAFAVVECNCDNITVIKPRETKPYVTAVNAFHSESMSSYQPNEELDDWQQAKRYHDVNKALEHHQDSFSLSFMKELLSGKHGFICQYDRTTGKDTVWSVIYDVIHKKIYRVEGNPGRKSFREDMRMKFK